MKRTTFLLAAVLCLVFADQAQAQRRLPSQQGIQLTAGTVNKFNPGSKRDGAGFHAGVAFSSYTKSGNHWLFGGEYLQKHYLYNDMRLPLVQFTGDGGYFLNFLSDGSKTFFSRSAFRPLRATKPSTGMTSCCPTGQLSKTKTLSCTALL